MIVFITFFILISLLLIISFISMSNGKGGIVNPDFVAKGKESGLSIKEIRMLKKAADILKLQKPLTILGSVNNVDNAILRLNKILEECDFNNYEIIDLLEELHSYRKNIELEKINKRSGITSSRELSINQYIKITVGNLENPILGIISEINPNYISVKLKNETVVKPGINWNGPINVYLWRKNDAGYFFESKVIETKSPLIWNISHTSDLIRSQKREDIRVEVEISCYVYELEDISKSNSNPMGFTGTFAQLKNISEGGAAFLTNGKVVLDTALKIEFKLEERIIVLCGIVKDSSYNKLNNISYVRIKVINPSFEILAVLRPFLFIKSRELFQRKEFKTIKAVENKVEINNNNGKLIEVENISTISTDDTDDDEITEVEYLSEDTSITN